MPKIIPNLSENILKESRSILLDPGRQELAIRDVAKACGVAVGTVYNYFPSKEYLVAAVLLEDWNNSLEKAKALCAETGDVMSCLEGIYGVLCDYVRLYDPVWQKNVVPPAAGGFYSEKHRTLVDAVTELIRGLRGAPEEAIAEMIAVLLTERCQFLTDFTALKPGLEKLLA